MYLRWLFYVTAILNVLFALGFLFVPDAVASAYGSTADPLTVAVARYFAATQLPLAWVAYVAAGAGGSALKLTLVRAFAGVGLLNLVVTFLAMQAGVFGAAGMAINYVLAAIFLIGFGYYGWVKSEAATM